VAKFGETDLLCHRAATPRALVARETEIWDPLLAWAQGELGAHLVKVIGVLPQTQPPETLAALERAAAALDDFRLTGLAHAAGLAGSAIIAFALERRAIEADAAFEAAALDELHQIATWGEDREARRRLEHLRCELAALAGYFAALA
jgi:chaperone required for assembly of F1-ATPase